MTKESNKQNRRLQTFGTQAVVEVPGLLKLMQFICSNGFEHHTAMNASRFTDPLVESYEQYLGCDVYHHES